MAGIDLNKIIASLVPLLLAAMWWVISSISAIHQDISSLQANMMMLINPQGQIIPSPGNAIERQKLREDLIKEIHEIQVRVSILEKAE